MVDRVRVPERLWSFNWVVIVRFILYAVMVGYFLQYLYFSDEGRFYRPGLSILLVSAFFFLNLVIMLAGAGTPRQEQLTVLTYIFDLVTVSWVVLSTGGLNSVFTLMYLPVLIMAAAMLPRRFTAVFPSIATLGIAVIGFAHYTLLYSDLAPEAFDADLVRSLRVLPEHMVVATMLTFSVLFFVVSYLSGVLSDRVFVEQQLNSEILASMNDGVAVVTRQNRLAYVNGEFIRLFPDAQPRGDFSRVAPNLFPEMDDDFNLEKLWGMETGEGRMLVREFAGSGERPPVEIRATGIRLRRRKGFFGILFLVTDMTLRRRMEKAENSLERFSAISTMAAGLAHEIRNPLAALRSAIQEIGRFLPEDGKDRRLMEVVISESDRLDGVIGRFLDFSREGSPRLGRRRLGGMLRKVQTMITQGKAEGELSVALRIDADPEVVCDGDRIMQVFINLALNASEFVPNPGGAIDISMSEAGNHGQRGVAIMFEDNGPGIAPETMEHLFEPFFSCRQGGTGMGLPLSRKEVSLHGGEIDVWNRSGGGACFRVWLPLRPPEPGTSGRSVTREFRNARLR